MSAELVALITGRNALLNDRFDSADRMGVLDVAWADAIVGEKEFLLRVLRELVGVPVVDEVALAREVGELVHRASMHLDVFPVDFGAVERHLRDALALALIEATG